MVILKRYCSRAIVNLINNYYKTIKKYIKIEISEISSEIWQEH